MTPKSHERIALFPGSFRPFTRGHQDIVSRTLAMFDRVVIARGINPDKADSAEDDEDLRTLRALYVNEPRVTVTTYSGLTATFAAEIGATAIVRGIRGVADMEYERDMAQVNRALTGIETILLFTDPALQCVSSSMVRQLRRFGADTDPFLPA